MGAVGAGTLDVLEVLETIERKVQTLEICARRRLGPREQAPAAPPPREFRSARALYNAIDSSVLRLEKCIASLPRSAVEGRSHIHADLIDYDPGEKFLKQVQVSITQMLTAAQRIGLLKSEFGEAASIVHRQAELLSACVRAEAELISKASKMAKPQNPDTLKEHCESLVDASVEVSELKYDVKPRSPLHNHVMALADASAALGWVVSPAALKHVREYKNVVNGLTESILASYIDLGCNPIHSDFAESLNAFMDTLADYVNAEHPAGLRWNYAAGAIPLGYRRVERKVDPYAHPFGDFYKIYHGALACYYSLSRELGGHVAKQSDALVSAYTELGKAIEAASAKMKPTGNGEPELRMILMSLTHELGTFPVILAEAGPDYRYLDHMNAITEFLSVFQWCTASLNKMSPVSFIIDVQAVTNMYLDRLVDKFSFPLPVNEADPEDALLKRDTENYLTRLHRDWADSVRDMLSELNEYVRTHHPNGLTFDTQRTRKSMEVMCRKRDIASEIASCKASSTARKWKLSTVPKKVKGRMRQVQAWV